MTGCDWLAERFEENRGHLRAVAYRMLGSVNEAEVITACWCCSAMRRRALVTSTVIWSIWPRGSSIHWAVL